MKYLNTYKIFESNLKARLLFTNDCNRACKGCCNKNWIGEPPRLITKKNLAGYDKIFITGGEPMLYPEQLLQLIKDIKEYNNTAEIFLYTALPKPLYKFLEIIKLIDGCTITLHNYKDRDYFIESGLNMMEFPNKNMRLNAFTRGKLELSDSWDYRPKKWIKNAPLPEGEDFVKLEESNKDKMIAKTKEEKEQEKIIKKRWEKKRTAISELGRNIKKLRQKVSKFMDSPDEKTKMVATIVRIIDLTGERIGNENSKNEGHHGVSNFYKKHIKVNGDTTSFSYIGKSGIKHNISVKDSKVARNLKEFMKIPGEVFITSDGYSIKSAQVNKFLHDFNITSKDLRGYRVNKLISERLRKLKKPETIGEIKKKFNEVLRQVAEEIGHTPGICRKNYLLPEIEEQWYDSKEIQKI